MLLLLTIAAALAADLSAEDLQLHGGNAATWSSRPTSGSQWEGRQVSVPVTAGTGFHMEEPSHQGIIGRDVLDLRAIEYLGNDRRYMIAF